MPQGPIRKGAGQRRHRVEIQKPTRETDDMGGEADIVWVTHTTFYAAVEPASALAGGERPDLAYTITGPYRQTVLVEQRAAAQRALANDQAFTVLAAIDPETKHRDLILQCVEIDI